MLNLIHGETYENCQHVHFLGMFIASSRVLLSVKSIPSFYISIVQPDKSHYGIDSKFFHPSDTISHPHSFGPFVLVHPHSRHDMHNIELQILLASTSQVHCGLSFGTGDDCVLLYHSALNRIKEVTQSQDFFACITFEPL